MSFDANLLACMQRALKSESPLHTLLFAGSFEPVRLERLRPEVKASNCLFALCSAKHFESRADLLLLPEWESLPVQEASLDLIAWFAPSSTQDLHQVSRKAWFELKTGAFFYLESHLPYHQIHRSFKEAGFQTPVGQDFGDSRQFFSLR